jgi:hypothetical protein
MVVKRETTMSTRELPSGGGANPKPEMRVLLGSDEGPISSKEEHADDGAAKWARGLPHICDHKCLTTMKRG